MSNSGKVIFVNYFGELMGPHVQGIMATCTNLIGKEKPDELYFLFSSRGGDVDAGIALYNFLKALPVRITMHNIASIDSIANVVFLSGKRRYAAPNTSFLFHGAKTQFVQGSAVTLEQLRELESRLALDQQKICKLICENTKITKDEFEELLLAGKARDENFAKEKNVIEEIRVPEIPKDASIISFYMK